MLTFAVLDANNIVENVIVADSLEIAESVTRTTCIQYDETNPAYIGWKYNGITFVDLNTQ
jgi:hypothetical protein